MFRLDHKLKISLIGSALLMGLSLNAADAGVSNTYANGKRVVDGGVTYPVKDGKTSAYHVNSQKDTFKHGRVATKNEIKAWDIDVMPDGTGLPEGKGSVEEGEEIYEEQCIACHADFGTGMDGYPALAKGNAKEGQESLTFQRTTPDKDGPVRVVGTYWPQMSTLWWYIKTGMPHNAPLSLSDDEVYALCAYIMNVNEMEFDGAEVEEDFVLDRAKFLKIVMPNKDGFVPSIDGPKGVENIRAYLSKPENYGNGKRCMKDCKNGAKVVRIQTEINDFLPPMSVKRDLPKVKAGASKANAGEAVYKKTCAMCHDSGAAGAPVVGDKDVWAEVTKGGIDGVYKNAITGKGAMPPKGGATVSDDEFKAVVDYMINKSK